MARNRSDGPARKEKELPSEDFLAQLGERVRTTRARRAMSRKVLARQSKVSERYLAQLELGKGNCSIVLLRRIAKAMGVPVAELIDDRSEREVEHVLLEQLIDRLSPVERKEARDLLLSRFGGPSREDRRGRVAMIGLRGGGKSTLGKLLATELGIPFVELDREIEKLSGMALSEIFEMFGQPTYRRFEREALEKVLADNPRFVLATGGSLVTEPATYELLLTSCFTVWVRTGPDQHMNRVIEQGDLRPMAENAKAMDDLVSILRSREPLYAKADRVLDTAGRKPEQSLRELTSLIDYPKAVTSRRSA